jgi:hypothetical protein
MAPSMTKGGGQPIAAQAGNEGLRPPFAERGLGLEAFADAGAAAQTGHLRGDCGLVDEHQAAGLPPHPRLALVDPNSAPLSDVGAHALRRHQLFFYMRTRTGTEAATATTHAPTHRASLAEQPPVPAW